MGFGMFSAQASPIAIDFGSASVKLLQIGSGGERPPLLAAAEVPVPDSIRAENDRLQAFYAEWLPKILRDGKFRGKRAVIAVPSTQTFIQHMQISDSDGLSRDETMKIQLQTQMGCSPHGVVVRSMEVCPVHRNGQAQKEVICIAITKETVMSYVELLRKCKLEVVGVHTDTIAMIRAFDHVNRRQGDSEVTTLYVDLGWGSTRVAITHGPDIMFARVIPIGGKNFDQLIAAAVHCDMASARAHRLSLQSSLAQAHPPQASNRAHAEGMAMMNAGTAKGSAMGASEPQVVLQTSSTATATIERRTGAAPPALNHPVAPGDAPRKAVNVDLSELLDTITDELSMCLRYHQGLFPDRRIDRAILVGGESRQSWLCQHIVKTLRVSAQMGDPLARLDSSGALSTPGLTRGQPQPGWAVPCGLCTAPTDL